MSESASPRIVVGVTEASASQCAVDWAAERAAGGGETLELTCVVGGAVGAVGEDAVVAQAFEAARRLVELEADRVRIAHPDLLVVPHVEAGHPTDVLVSASEGAELLVIGREPAGHGHRGHSGGRIAAGAHSTVVVVPDGFDGAQGGTRRGVVVGVDGSEVSHHALRRAAAEAQRLGQPLVVVSAWMPVFVSGDFGIYPEMYTTNLQGVTEELVAGLLDDLGDEFDGLEVQRRVEQGDPATVINDAASAAVLTVVGTHGRTGLVRFLLGSVSEEVLSHLAAPTMLVR